VQILALGLECQSAFPSAALQMIVESPNDKTSRHCPNFYINSTMVGHYHMRSFYPVLLQAFHDKILLNAILFVATFRSFGYRCMRIRWSLLVQNITGNLRLQKQSLICETLVKSEVFATVAIKMLTPSSGLIP
jgi:hypothetical protein